MDSELQARAVELANENAELKCRLAKAERRNELLTDHYECKMATPERASRLENRLQAIVGALLAFDCDPHQFGTRPCQACTMITKALGQPWGCNRYSLTGKSYREAEREGRQ